LLNESDRRNEILRANEWEKVREISGEGTNTTLQFHDIYIYINYLSRQHRDLHTILAHLPLFHLSLLLRAAGHPRRLTPIVHNCGRYSAQQPTIAGLLPFSLPEPTPAAHHIHLLYFLSSVSAGRSPPVGCLIQADDHHCHAVSPAVPPHAAAKHFWATDVPHTAARAPLVVPCSLTCCRRQLLAAHLHLLPTRNSRRCLPLQSPTAVVSPTPPPLQPPLA